MLSNRYVFCVTDFAILIHFKSDLLTHLKVPSWSRTMLHFPDCKFSCSYIVQFELGDFCCLQKTGVSAATSPTHFTSYNYIFLFTGHFYLATETEFHTN